MMMRNDYSCFDHQVIFSSQASRHNLVHNHGVECCVRAEAEEKVGDIQESLDSNGKFDCFIN